MVPDLLKERLQSRLGYHFSDTALLELALTHRSQGAQNNERLEFLGDSILNFVVGEALFQRFPEAREGQLSRLRSQMVKGETLAQIAREFDLGDCLILGEGEMKSGGRKRQSILADTVEALIGAIYLESGFEPCAERVRSWYRERFEALSLKQPGKDAKTQLQEFLQARHMPLPDYQLVEREGSAHAYRFTIECRVAPLKEVVRADANNRRTAEKQAAAEMLAKLQSLETPPKARG